MITKSAFRNDMIPSLNWLAEKRRSSGIDFQIWMENAARLGAFKCMKWIYENAEKFIPSWTPSDTRKIFGLHVLRGACAFGSVPILEWIFEHEGSVYDESTVFVYEAASRGKWDATKWLKEKGFAINFYSLSLCAAQHGNLEILEWTSKECHVPLHEHHCEEAARGDQLETLKWLRERGCPWGYATTQRAAEQWNLDVLKWAIENGCPHGNTCIREALGWGDKEMVEWLLDHGCDWPLDALAVVASSSDPSLVDWVLSLDKPVSSDIMEDLVYNDHRDLIKTLFARGFPLSEGLSNIAAKLGKLELLKWLVANGCSFSPNGYYPQEIIDWWIEKNEI